MGDHLQLNKIPSNAVDMNDSVPCRSAFKEIFQSNFLSSNFSFFLLSSPIRIILSRPTSESNEKKFASYSGHSNTRIPWNRPEKNPWHSLNTFSVSLVIGWMQIRPCPRTHIHTRTDGRTDGMWLYTFIYVRKPTFDILWLVVRRIRSTSPTCGQSIRVYLLLTTRSTLMRSLCWPKYVFVCVRRRLYTSIQSVSAFVRGYNLCANFIEYRRTNTDGSRWEMVWERTISPKKWCRIHIKYYSIEMVCGSGRGIGAYSTFSQSSLCADKHSVKPQPKQH